jgi:hypothetical protein
MVELLLEKGRYRDLMCVCLLISRITRFMDLGDVGVTATVTATTVTRTAGTS